MADDRYLIREMNDERQLYQMVCFLLFHVWSSAYSEHRVDIVIHSDRPIDRVSQKMWQYICDHNSGKPRWIFNNFYISRNENECPPQLSYLLIFTCDVNMTSLSRWWHWWAETASAACVARLRAVADWWRSWPMANMLACLCSCQWWIFNMLCDYQFIFSVLHELYVSHHAWCRGYSKSAL